MSKMLFEVDVSMSLPVYAEDANAARLLAREVLTMELHEAQLTVYDVHGMTALPREWLSEIPYGEEEKTCSQILMAETT